MPQPTNENGIRTIVEPVSLAFLKEVAAGRFGDMVKAVVDVEKNIMVIGADLHADEEAILLENGSEQMHLWGINLYPGIAGENFIEFDSMINLRPKHNNRSRGVDDVEIQKKIRGIVQKLISYYG